MTTRDTARDTSFLPMATFTKESMRLVKQMEKVFTFGEMERSMMENGRKDRSTEVESGKECMETAT